MKTNKYYFLVKAFSLIGVILAVYLLWQQFFRSDFQPCYVNSVVNCDAIITGEVAKTFGLPTPLYGLVGYIVIFIAASLRKKKLLLGTAMFGLGFCLWIAYRELFELSVICPVCIICQIIMITVFVLGSILFKQKQTLSG